MDNKAERSLFNEYIKNGHFDQYYYFSNSKNLFFHWADSVMSCEAKMKYLNLEERKNDQTWQKIQKSLQQLKESPVWLRSKRGVFEMSLYELYQTYLLRDQFFKNTFHKDNALAFSGPSGLYRPIIDFKWFSKAEYKKLVYDKIFDRSLNLRDFRLRIKAPILGFLGEEKKDQKFMTFYIQQMTKRGILISCAGPDGFRELKNKKEITLFLDYKIFELHQVSNLQRIKEEFSKLGEGPFLTRNLEKKFKIKIDVDDDGEVQNLSRQHYLFVPYEQIIGNQDHGKFRKVMQAFTLSAQRNLGLAI